MKILAFAASNHSKSINCILVYYAAMRMEALCPEVEIEFVDINEYEMPIYSIDREKADGIHQFAQAFFEKIGACDAMIVSFAEHNGFVTAAWKNIYDWMSRIDQKVWQNKPVAILAATPGPRAGQNVLKTQEVTAPFFGMDIKGKYGVGNWKDAWDGAALTNNADIQGVDQAINGLIP